MVALVPREAEDLWALVRAHEERNRGPCRCSFLSFARCLLRGDLEVDGGDDMVEI